MALILGRRRFIEDIDADIVANDQFRIDNIFSNTTNNISGDDVATWMAAAAQIKADQDVSLIADEAILFLDAPPVALLVDGTWRDIILFDTVEGGDATFLKTDLLNGTITLNTEAGWTYSGRTKLVVEDLANNIEIQIAFGVDGVPAANIDTESGRGPNNAVSLSVDGLVKSSLSDSVISLMVRLPAGGSDTVSVTAATMLAVIQPTNDPN